MKASLPLLLTAVIFQSLTALAADEPKGVVNFAKLIPILPEPPTGWTAEKAEGSSMQTGEFNLTTVNRTYTQGEGESAKSVSLHIMDSVANKQFFDVTTATWNMSQETTEGYMKSVTIDGNKGFETFTNEGQSGGLWVVVASRFFVQVETTHLPAAELQAWIKRLDLKKLAEVK